MLAACTQEEPSFPTEGVEGAYPLQISSVTLAVEAGEEPWTRISESQDGQSSAWDWDGSEQIAVQLAGETAVYTLNADQTLTPDKQLYWQNTAPATVTAWYPINTDIDLSDQSQRLAYVLQATVPDAPYNQPVSLAFTHQLAKVRVTLSGSRAGQVTQVEAYGPTSCTQSQGTVAPGSAQGWIKMHQVDAATWEANLAPGTIADPNQFIRLNGSTPVALTAPGQLTAGAMHTINVLVKAPLITGPGYTIDPDLHTITLESGTALNQEMVDTALGGTGTLVINGLLSEADYGLIDNSYNTRITSLTLNDIERIEESRLGGMIALQSITLPKATYVGSQAFGNSPNLSVVSLTAEGPITLGDYAFGPTFTTDRAALTLNADKRGEVSGNTWNGITWGSIAFQE